MQKKKLKIKGFFIVALFCMVLLSTSTDAGDFEGSKPLICAVIQVFECLNNGGCKQVLPEEVNFPQFLKVNFKENLIKGTLANNQKETTPIEHTERIEDKLILSGAEAGMGWSFAISDENGKFVLTASGDQVGFVVFGACTPD